MEAKLSPFHIKAKGYSTVGHSLSSNRQTIPIMYKKADPDCRNDQTSKNYENQLISL